MLWNLMLLGLTVPPWIGPTLLSLGLIGLGLAWREWQP